MSIINFSKLLSKIKKGGEQTPPDLPEENNTKDNTVNKIKKIFKKSDKSKGPSSDTPPFSKLGSRKLKENPSENVLLEFFSIQKRPLWHKLFLLILVSVITYKMGSLVAIKLASLAAPTKITPPSAKRVDSNRKILSDLINIKNKNIFNAKDPKAVAKVPKKPESKVDRPCLTATTKTSMPFKLSNTFVLQDRKKSVAFITISNKPSAAYREKDILNNQARIDRIDRLYVYLKNLRNKKCEYISNIDERFEESFKRKKMEILSAREGKALIKENLKNKINVKGNKIFIKKSLRDDVLKDIQKVLTQARAIQIKKPDGTLEFKIVEIEPGSVYSLLDIDNGDIITGIDGKPIQNLNDIISLFGKIKNIKHLTLTIKKSGEEKIKEYSFEN
jgi:type II secretory pathway component PulC